jgi:hypothetical protein
MTKLNSFVLLNKNAEKWLQMVCTTPTGVIFLHFGRDCIGAQYIAFRRFIGRRMAAHSYMEPGLDESTPLGGRRTKI